MPAHHDIGVILQALADRQIDTDGDHQLGQVAGRADTRKQQQLRRIVCAGGQDDFRLGVDLLKLPVADDFDAARPRPIEQNPGRERVRDDLQVWTAERRMEKGDRGAAAHAVALGELIEADAVLLLAVEVGIAGMPASTPASTKASISEYRDRPSLTVNGPRLPWNWSSPRSLASDRRK